MGVIVASKNALKSLLQSCPVITSYFSNNIEIWAKEIDGTASNWPLVYLSFKEGNTASNRMSIGNGPADFENNTTQTIVLEKLGVSSDEQSFVTAIDTLMDELKNYSGPTTNNLIVNELELTACWFDDERYTDDDNSTHGIWTANIRISHI